MTALTSILDEASELVVHAVAGYDSEPVDLQEARHTISEVRAGNSIRREGDLYVAEDMPSDDPFLARIGLRAVPQFDDDDLTPNDAPPSEDELDLAARNAPPGYRPGKGEQGDAGGEESQDLEA